MAVTRLNRVSVVLDLDEDEDDVRRPGYPCEATDNATADVHRRLVGAKVDE